jgi:hypothetical protein
MPTRPSGPPAPSTMSRKQRTGWSSRNGRRSGAPRHHSRSRPPDGRPGSWRSVRPRHCRPGAVDAGQLAIPIQPVRKASHGHGVALGAGSRHGAPSHVMATWGVVLATGFVTIMAAVLPMLVESKTDKARRAEEKAERRRHEKKAAFAAYLVAATELTGSSFDQDSGGALTARGHAAVQGLASIRGRVAGRTGDLHRLLSPRQRGKSHHPRTRGHQTHQAHRRRRPSADDSDIRRQVPDPQEA